MVSRDELFHEISMPYQDLVDYLKEKYGPARYNYFYKDNCRSRRPEVSRTTEGLICHHIREDMGGNLSNKSQAIIQPYEWQLKQNLVYCNLLEHLLLHFKIAVLRQKAKLKQPYDILQFFTTDGIYMVANQINGLFKKNGTQTKWLNNLYIAIRDNYSDYTLLLSALMRYIDSQYIGPRDIDSKLVIGAKVNFSDCSAEVLKVSSRKDVFLLKMPDGSSKPFYTSSFYKQLSYQDAIDITILDLSKDISIEGPLQYIKTYILILLIVVIWTWIGLRMHFPLTSLVTASHNFRTSRLIETNMVQALPMNMSLILSHLFLTAQFQSIKNLSPIFGRDQFPPEYVIT